MARLHPWEADTNPSRVSLVFLLLLTLAAVGCTPAPIVAARVIDTLSPPTQEPTSILAPTALPAPTSTPLPAWEPIQQPEPTAIPDQQVALEPVIQPTPDALILDLPDSSGQQDPGWRPALYPIPWAARPEDHFYFNRPILANENFWPLDDYRYGYTYEGFDNVHTGIDIDSPIGTNVYAAAGGKVIWCGFGEMSGTIDPNDPYGLSIVIRHNFGFKDQRLYTLYAHLSKAFVQTGDLMETGQLLGQVGLTGATTGPHLHFEVRQGANDYFATRNPELWLVPAQGWGVIAGQVKDTAGRLVKGREVYLTSLDTGKRWTAVTYGSRSINSDDYYQENVVISDLPAGKYQVMFEYLYQRYYQEIEVLPGRISTFLFQGRSGFLPPPANSSGSSLQPAE